MRYLIICLCALLMGYAVLKTELLEPAGELLTLTAERIVNERMATN